MDFSQLGGNRLRQLMGERPGMRVADSGGGMFSLQGQGSGYAGPSGSATQSAGSGSYSGTPQLGSGPTGTYLGGGTDMGSGNGFTSGYTGLPEGMMGTADIRSSPGGGQSGGAAPMFGGQGGSNWDAPSMPGGGQNAALDSIRSSGMMGGTPESGYGSGQGNAPPWGGPSATPNDWGQPSGQSSGGLFSLQGQGSSYAPNMGGGQSPSYGGNRLMGLVGRRGRRGFFGGGF